MHGACSCGSVVLLACVAKKLLDRPVPEGGFPGVRLRGRVGSLSSREGDVGASLEGSDPPGSGLKLPLCFPPSPTPPSRFISLGLMGAPFGRSGSGQKRSPRRAPPSFGRTEIS